MIHCKLSEIASATQGRLHGSDLLIDGVSIDSRRLTTGNLFVAIKGERFDGHRFVEAAFERGARAAMVNVNWALPAALPSQASLVVVEDTRLALGDLAANWRRSFTLPLIGLTGSNGKTTTKELLAAGLRRVYGDAVLATKGNLNNDLGVPLTVLELDDRCQVAVIEMGMNHPGEIAVLAKTAAPTVALVTNAMRAHLQGLVSLRAVAEEKGAIYQALAADGIAVIPGASEFAGQWAEIAAPRRVIRYGFADAAHSETFEVSAQVTTRGLTTMLDLCIRLANGEHHHQPLLLTTPGRHNAENALAAIACALAIDVPLSPFIAGLASFAGVDGRLTQKRGLSGSTLIDDSYNANPDSFRAAIDVLSGIPGRKVLVMGDMGETGEGTAQYHDEIGGYAKIHGVDHLLTLGDASPIAARNFGQGGESFADINRLVAKLKTLLSTETTVLIKGSRFMQMERVVSAVTAPEENVPC